MRQLICVSLLIVIIVFACSRSVDSPNAPLPPTLKGKWVLTDIQSAGAGGPGVWSAAPAGKSFQLQDNGALDGGTMFPGATGWSFLDSVRIKIYAPNTPGGFFLFGTRIDTANAALFFYIYPPDGVTHCIEGCGAYRFVK